MKPVLAALLLLFFAVTSYAISVEEIARLSKLKTNDDLLIQIIQKDKLTKPLSSKDILFLKEQGVSDRVIGYLVQTSGTKGDYIAENLRVAYTTDQKGKQHRVVTNMDEKGNRLGPELSPEAKQAPPVEYQSPEPPREVYVIVKDENEGERNDYEEDYPEEPPYDNGIPLYDSYYPGYAPYAPYYDSYYFPHQHGHGFGDLNQPNWRFRARPPQTRRSASHTSHSRSSIQRPSVTRSPSAGTRTSMVRSSAGRSPSGGARSFQRR